MVVFLWKKVSGLKLRAALSAASKWGIDMASYRTATLRAIEVLNVLVIIVIVISIIKVLSPSIEVSEFSVIVGNEFVL